MDIGYARVSTLDQDPAIQTDALARAGCDNVVEEKVSGVAAKRPVRDQVLAQLKTGDTLTVWKLDRLGRSMTEVVGIVQKLEQRGIRFRCLTQPVDTTSASGRLQLQLLAAFAEFERALIRERTMAGKRLRVLAGKHPGGARMYGFDADHETIIEAEADLLRTVTDDLLNGQPIARVVDTLNQQGVPPVKADRWRVNTLQGILLNPRVVPIIGQNAYDKLARLLTAPDRRRGGRPAEYLLSGILYCAREGCEQPLYAGLKRGQGQARQLIYRCKRSQGSGGRFNGCGSTAVSLPRADAWAEEMFIAAIVSEELAASLNRRQAELLAGDATAEELDEWRADLAELEQVLPTRYATEDMKRRHAQLRRMVREATAQLMARPDLQALLDLPRSEDKLRARWEGWSTAERRAWLRRLVERIEVHPATSRSRASSVEDRLHPVWKI